MSRPLKQKTHIINGKQIDLAVRAAESLDSIALDRRDELIGERFGGGVHDRTWVVLLVAKYGGLEEVCLAHAAGGVEKQGHSVTMASAMRIAAA